MDINTLVKLLYVFATFAMIQGTIIIIACYLDFKERRDNEDIKKPEREWFDATLHENEKTL